MIRILRFVVVTVGAVLASALFVILKEVFAGRFIINPIAISIGPLEIRWYGIIIAAGILLALEWTMRRAKARGLDLALVERATFVAIIGGIVGARMIYVAQNVDYFTAHSSRILALTDGGLSIHGALLGGALALYLAIKVSHAKNPPQSPFIKGEERTPLFCKEGQGEATPSFHKGGLGRIYGVGQMFAQITDAVVPGLLLAMILGRLGNFANAELFGPPTNLPWKLFIPEAARPTGLESVAYYHPTFLYDIFLNSIVLIGLLWIEHRWVVPGSPSRWRLRLLEGGGGVPGTLTMWFFLGIATTRFIVEFWRIGDSIAFGLSLAQIVSILIAVSAVSTLVATHRLYQKTM